MAGRSRSFLHAGCDHDGRNYRRLDGFSARNCNFCWRLTVMESTSADRAVRGGGSCRRLRTTSAAGWTAFSLGSVARCSHRIRIASRSDMVDARAGADRRHPQRRSGIGGADVSSSSQRLVAIATKDTPGGCDVPHSQRFAGAAGACQRGARSGRGGCHRDCGSCDQFGSTRCRHVLGANGARPSQAPADRPSGRCSVRRKSGSLRKSRSRSGPPVPRCTARK